MQTATPTQARPLDGIRVVDLSTVLSGPLAAAMLADQGAAVIKVEAHEGDTSRRIGPAKGDLSAMFIAANRGKRCIALNLKAPQGRAVLLDLVRRADVLVDNMRPEVLVRLGLGPDTLQAANPRLVHASITGFGPDGPYAEGRAYDAVIQALSGMCASHPSPVTGDATLMTTTICDKLTGLTCAQAISSALFARERTGRGQRIGISMLDAALAFQWPDAMYNHVFIDTPPPAAPEFGTGHKPWKTRDGALTTNTPQRSELVGLCTVLGRPELADDPRFSTIPALQRNGPALRAELQPAMEALDTDTAVRLLGAAGVPVGRVNTRAEVLTDPQVVHNRSLRAVPNGDAGAVRLARGAARFGADDDSAPGPGAHLGEHTVEVLQELGLDAAAIDALLSADVARAWRPAAR
jgi:crotonobetainyl-CoA:carnitine CoA-transferase CaiB-like acyl-CoA transferase